MAAETTGAAGPGRGGRMSRRRKRDAVLRLLRGEDLETVSRGLGVAAATLSGLAGRLPGRRRGAPAALYTLPWSTGPCTGVARPPSNSKGASP